jgi:solute carrier family 25 protein 39/40
MATTTTTTTTTTRIGYTNDTSSTSSKDWWWIPAFAGGAARALASCTTAPLELLRTRQAARVGNAVGNAQPSLGMMEEFKSMIQKEGVVSLYKGFLPTLLRDVPFSAIYWVSIEQMRLLWRQQQPQQPQGDGSMAALSAWHEFFQNLVNGSVSGMIAAACTTPLDVVKTRQQVMGESMVGEVWATTTATSSSAAATACDHKGARVYAPNAAPFSTTITTNATTSGGSTSSFSMLQDILKREGLQGLWRGNTTRMIKVAPGCAIMISSYEMGKRFLACE